MRLADITENDIMGNGKEALLVVRKDRKTLVRPGERIAGDTVDIFRHVLQLAVSVSEPIVLVDLVDVRVMASEAIFVLKECCDEVRKRCGVMRTGNVPDHLMTIFRDIALDETMDFVDDLTNWDQTRGSRFDAAYC